jgi:hypothetical protein
VSVIHKLTNSIRNKEELPDQWKGSIILPIQKKGDKTNSLTIHSNLKSTTDQICCIRQILEKKWEYNETACQLFIDFKETYDSVRREVLYNILVEFGVPMKLV